MFSEQTFACCRSYPCFLLVMRYASEVYLAPKEYTDLIKPYAPGDSLKFRDGRGKLEYFVVEKLDSDIVYAGRF